MIGSSSRSHRLICRRSEQAIGMALHKLATNAGKYGALSKAGGTIEIIRGLDQAAGNPQFTLSWVEAGGPPVIPRSGPGSERPVLTPYLVWSWMPKSLSFTHTKDYAGALSAWLRECLKSRLILRPRARPLQKESHESTSIGGRG